MIAVDTNILLYAHRAEVERHEAAYRVLKHLAEGREPWSIPCWCVIEFVRVATHPRVFHPPSTLDQAVDHMKKLLASPSVALLTPGDKFGEGFLELVGRARASGNLAFDAAIAALCRDWGVRKILTEDRDFSRFEGLQAVTIDRYESMKLV